MTQAESNIAAALIQRWRMLLLCCAVGVAAATTYAFVAPRWYEARLTVIPSQRSDDMNLVARLPSLGGLSSSFQTDVARIRAVLTSNSVTDAVIEKFDLMKRYEAEHIELARTALWSHCRTSVDKKSGVVELLCEDKDPQSAKEITAYFGDVGNQVFGRISASSAREERRFLEKQVVQARKDVDEASRQLREFQEKHKLIDLPEQSKAVISAMANIKGELISKQLELSYVTSFSSPTEPRVVQLEQQIAILEGKMRQLGENESASAKTPAPKPSGTGSAGSGSADGDFFPEAMQVPELRFELEQLIREQKIKETLFFLMTQRFETAKVDEARDTSTFQILDYPTVPTYKSRPRRTRIMMLGLFAGGLIGCAWIGATLLWRKRRS